MTVIGEPTGGGGQPFDYRHLTENFTLWEPVSRSINPITGGSWQGSGVPIDVPGAGRRRTRGRAREGARGSATGWTTTMTAARPGPDAVASMVGRLPLVTGASRGIGAATALAFAAAGAAVALVSRDRNALGAVHARIRSEGGRSVVVPADVSDVADTERMVATTVEALGRLDMAVNSAAAHGQRPTPLAGTSVADFDDTISVSLRGVFLSMRHQIPAIIDAGGGAIVNVASTAGLTAVGGLAAYVTAKHGLIGLTKTAALDHAADGVRVNALAPGPTHTEQLDRAGPEARKRVAASVPSGRLGRPHEVTAAAVWLCSDQASFITGATLVADGGLLAGSRPFTGPAREEQS